MQLQGRVELSNDSTDLVLQNGEDGSEKLLSVIQGFLPLRQLLLPEVVSPN